MCVLSVQYSCAVVSVFLFGGKANLVLLTLFYSTLLALTHRVSYIPQDVLFYVFGRWCRLSGGCAIIITSGKKVLVICLAGARSLLRPEKKVLVVCLAGARSLLRPEKKVLVICLAGARCIEFECNKFVLVLVQIVLIHFEHSICISST